MSKPTVGRIVHVDRGLMADGMCEAAIVTSPAEENDGFIHVSVFTASGGIYPMVLHAENDNPKHWHWPERE